MAIQRDGRYVKKGPWTAEEDEILLNYVNEYGPRDWSSLRSNGLLPRTGKSCRLRWVNKLRPNLKKCKFSAEEERVVIELQAQFGNKWAKIATYLPGRTDNDVKNFWSTRRKRMERMLQGNSSSKLQHNKGKKPLSSEHSHIGDIKWTSFPAESSSLPYMDNPNFVHELETSEYHQPIQMIPSAESSTNCCLFEFPDYHQLDIPLYLGCQDLIPAVDNHSHLDEFLDQKTSETKLNCCHNSSTSRQETETVEHKVMDSQKRGSTQTANLDTFDYLDDLPIDLLDLDFLESLP